MRIGVVFPQLDLGGDVAAVRAYGQGVERLGFSHVLAYDHVLGSDPEVHAPWYGPYDIDTTFHEPLVMFGYLAGVTQLELVTGILILPQRQPQPPQHRRDLRDVPRRVRLLPQHRRRLEQPRNPEQHLAERLHPVLPVLLAQLVRPTSSAR